MTPEKRKVQITGGATLIVSLPIKWAREIGLSAGDEIFLAALALFLLEVIGRRVREILQGNPMV